MDRSGLGRAMLLFRFACLTFVAFFVFFFLHVWPVSPVCVSLCHMNSRIMVGASCSGFGRGGGRIGCCVICVFFFFFVVIALCGGGSKGVCIVEAV